MKIENNLTLGINTLVYFGSGEILVGNENGIISLWQYRLNTLVYIKDYEFTKNNKRVRCILKFSENHFIAIREDKLSQEAEITLWDTNYGHCQMTMQRGSVTQSRIDSAVLLTNNLLVVSGHTSPAWQCFDVWDTDSGRCIFTGQQYCHRPHGLSLAITAQGFLVAAGHCTDKMRVWRINRSECTEISSGEIDRIYSMATLPTGEIVTGNHNLDFYKISFDDRGIYKYKSIENSNVIDAIYPIGGYKLLVVDRSNANSGTLKLWNYLEENYNKLGDSRTGSEVTEGHIILEKENVVLSLGENKIVINVFSKGIFRFPNHFAEIRKNSRILSQAHRTGTSYFLILPQEICVRIAAITCNFIQSNQIKSNRVLTKYEAVQKEIFLRIP